MFIWAHAQPYSLAETPQPPPPPTAYEGGYWSAKIDDISLWPSGPNSLSSAMREAAAGNTGTKHIRNYPKKYYNSDNSLTVYKLFYVIV